MRRGSVRARGRRAVAASPEPAHGLHRGATAPYDLLPEAAAQRVIDAALELLAEVGVGFEPRGEALELFADRGCAVSTDGVVRIPERLVRDSLDSAAKSARLWDRAGERAITLDADHTWFLPGMTCIKVYDLETGERRASNRADLETVTRVADALPHIDGVCIACKNVERSDIHGEIDEFAAMAENTTKPLEYLCEHARSLEVVIDLAAAVRGSHEALRERPYFLHIVTPLPLNFARTHADQIITAARAGVPVTSGTLPIGGASAPITVAGCMANSLATDFAALVLGQLAREGAFCIGGSDVCFMEPATGGIGGFAPTSLADMAMCQIRRRLGLPSFTGIAGASVARRFGEDAVWEITATMMQTFYSRPATCDYLGSLDEGITFSLHALLLCDDLAGLLRNLWAGIEVDDEHLALGLARELGPRGSYLGQRHTAEHCRRGRWNTRYFGTHIPLSSSVAPEGELGERIDADLRRILDTHRPRPLDPATVERMRSIQHDFEAGRWRGLEPRAVEA